MNYIFFTHDKFNDHFVKKAQPLLQKKKKGKIFLLNKNMFEQER